MNNFYKRMSNEKLFQAYESSGAALTQTLNEYEAGHASEKEVQDVAERTRAIGNELVRRRVF